MWVIEFLPSRFHCHRFFEKRTTSLHKGLSHLGRFRRHAQHPPALIMRHIHTNSICFIFIYPPKANLSRVGLLMDYPWYSDVISLFSLHIRSMWETICDASACWSGWNFVPNPTEYPYSVVTWYRIPPLKNENCQRVQIQVSPEYPPPPQWKLSESPNPSVPEYPPPPMKIVRVQIWVSRNPPPPHFQLTPDLRWPKFTPKYHPPPFGKSGRSYVETNL